MSNPVLSHATSVSRGIHGPNYGVVTVDALVRTTAILFGILLTAAAVGWFLGSPVLVIIASLAALVIGFTAVLKRTVSPTLFILYAALQGYVLGFFSRFSEMLAPGVVSQAVLGTFAVFAVMLFLFKTGIVTGGSRIRRFVIIGMLAYLVFSLVNLVLMLTGITDSFGGMRTSITVMGFPIGMFIGAFAILLGALSLSVDFRDIQDSIGKAPEKMVWYLSFGLMVSLVWIYTEIVRLVVLVKNFTGQ